MSDAGLLPKPGHGGQDWNGEIGQQTGSRAHGERRATDPGPTPGGGYSLGEPSPGSQCP